MMGRILLPDGGQTPVRPHDIAVARSPDPDASSSGRAGHAMMGRILLPDGGQTPDNRRPHETADTRSTGRDALASDRWGLQAMMGRNLLPDGGQTPENSPGRSLRDEPGRATPNAPTGNLTLGSAGRDGNPLVRETPGSAASKVRADAIRIEHSPVREGPEMGDASPSARLGQRARSLPPERSPGFGADDGFEAGTPDQARKRASIRGAADVAGARRELLLPDGLAALTERGGKASTAEIKEQELDRECDKLATTFELWDLQRAIGYDDNMFDRAEPDDILKALRRKIRAYNQQPNQVSRTRCTYAAVRAWLARRDLDVQYAEEVPEHLLLLYLDEYRAHKLTKMADSQAEARDSMDDEHDGVPVATLRTRGKRKQTGASAGEYHRRGMRSLKGVYNLGWASSGLKAHFTSRGRAQHVPEPAQPPSVRMVQQLEEFVDDKRNSMVLRHLAAAYLFCCFAAMRVEQAQNCWIAGVRDQEIIEGYVALDKHPRRESMQPRPFWLETGGITGSNEWFEVLWDTLEGVRHQRFIFRAFRGKNAAEATEFLNGPLRSGHGLVEAIQAMLQKACGLTRSESEVYTLHGPRHFLPEVAMARGEPDTCRVELGRWSRSVAQLPSMRPTVRQVMLAKHNRACATMADLYAQHSAAARPIAIIKRQMAALRVCVQRHSHPGANPLPKVGGWDLVPKFSKSQPVGEFEE